MAIGLKIMSNLTSVKAMPEITLSTGARFTSAAGASILDASTKAHVSLPYSCRTGRCSTCKCKVISGNTSALQQEMGLTAEEKAKAQETLMFLTEKRDGTVKGRAVYNGKPTRE